MKGKRLALAMFVFIAIGVSEGMAFPSSGALCEAWLPAIEEGKLDSKYIDESSGLAVSRRFDRIYHVNDSGDGPHFYITDLKGSGTRRVVIEGFNPKDVEEIALGPCLLDKASASRSCVIVGDIGDNLARRKSIEIVFVEEAAEFGEKVKPVRRVGLRYPDRAHNAEAFAVLPNGDLIVVTKEGGRIEKATAAQVYRASKSDMLAVPTGKALLLKRIGQIDVPSLVKDDGLGGLVTAMSVTDDGKRFVLLTYGKAIEFRMDLSLEMLPPMSSLKAGQDYSIVPLTRLALQESIGYDRNNRDLYYSSEVFPVFFGRTPPPLMKMRCK